jgi:hypothetical protein
MAIHFIETLPTSFREEQIEAAKKGKLILYVYGRIFYDDVFKEGHSTKFCAFIDPSLKSFEACPWSNEAN